VLLDVAAVSKRVAKADTAPFQVQKAENHALMPAQAYDSVVWPVRFGVRLQPFGVKLFGDVTCFGSDD
jgi:hypothetical protein